MKKVVFPIAIFLILIGWSCSKTNLNEDNLSVKESVLESAEQINTVADKIAASKGFQLLSVSEEGATAAVDSSVAAVKAEMEFRDSIDLDLIAGVYDFNPNPELHQGAFFPYMLFQRTGESENLIVNLPEQLVFHPKRLHFLNLADAVLENNFKITATSYHFYYNWWNSYDYKLTSSFRLNNEDIGNMEISSVWKSALKRKYSNLFNFTEGYTLIKTGQTGDTAKYVFALVAEKDTLLKESLIFTGDGFKRKEKEYVLSIGDVDIRKATGVDSIQVYLNGILQKKAGAKIVDTEDYNASIFHRRDILLTFDDGSQAKLSELISPALETLKKLSGSLDEMYVSKHIVDYIAFNIYYYK